MALLAGIALCVVIAVGETVNYGLTTWFWPVG